MSRIVPITTLILAGAFCTVHAADVYRWLDEHGGIHYTDRWVPGSELIKVSKIHPSGLGVDNARQTAEQKKVLAAGDRASAQLSEQATAQAVKQDVAKARVQQCKEAKDRYEKAIQARHIFKEGKDGAREYMSDPDVDAYRLQIRNEMQAACGSAPK